MKKQFLETGKIVGVHGLKGEVRIDPWCDEPEFITKFKALYKKDGTKLDIRSAKVSKNVAIVGFKDVKTVEEAEKLRGTVVYINREDAKLPDGVYFVQDIIGLEAVDSVNGTIYGVVTDVIQTGANDVYQITKDGKDYLIPKIPEVVESVDIENGRIIINTGIVGGLFEDED